MVSLTLNSATFERFVIGRSRPYSLFVFLAADHLKDKPQLRLAELRDEFGHLVRSFRQNHANTSETGGCITLDRISHTSYSPPASSR